MLKSLTDQLIVPWLRLDDTKVDKGVLALNPSTSKHQGIPSHDLRLHQTETCCKPISIVAPASYSTHDEPKWGQDPEFQDLE